MSSRSRRLRRACVRRSVRLDVERTRRRREPGVEDLRRFARSFEREQGPVDEVVEAGLVLFQREARGAWQLIVADQREIGGMTALLGVPEDQHLVGEKAVDALVGERGKGALVVVEER